MVNTLENKNAQRNLIFIKAVHTLVWAFFNAVLVYLFYAVFTDSVGTWFWIGIGLIVLECIILLIFRWTCPLTYLARRYSDSDLPNFDIYLPLWVAKHNKTIYSIIFAILVICYLVSKAS